jgi:multiple sugar transport system permease protein
MKITNTNWKTIRQYTEKILRTFLLFGMVFVILIPFLYQFSHAIRGSQDATNPLVIWIPETYTFQKFIQAYHRLEYIPLFIYTFKIAFITAIIQVISCSIAGYAFARLTFRGSNLLFYTVLASLVIPYETLYISRMLFFNNTPFLGMNLLTSNFAIYIMSIFGMGIRAPIFIFIFRSAFRSIPMELEEASYMDGASIVHCYTRLMLPIVKPAWVSVFVLSFIWQWNDWYFMHFFQFATRGKRSFATQLTSGIFRNASIEAANFLVMTPMIFAYLLFQHYWFKESDLATYPDL